MDGRPARPSAPLAPEVLGPAALPEASPPPICARFRPAPGPLRLPNPPIAIPGVGPRPATGPMAPTRPGAPAGALGRLAREGIIGWPELEGVAPSPPIRELGAAPKEVGLFERFAI